MTLDSSDIVEPKGVQPIFLEKLPKHREKPANLFQAKATSYQITTLLLDPDDKQYFKGYVINKYARPNGLIPVQRNRGGEEIHLQQSQGVKQFLERFDIRQLPELPPRGRKGFNGWKLTKAKSNNQSLLGGQGEDEEKPAAEGDAGQRNEKRKPGEEPYLEYIRWKNRESGA